MTPAPRFASPIKLLFLGLLLCVSLLAVAPAQAAAKDPDDRIVIHGPVLVDKGATVGDVVVLKGDVLVRGTVKGDLFVFDGQVTLRGRVTGDVIVVRQRAILGDRGHIEGDLRYGDEKPVGATSNKVDGDVEKFDFGSFGAGEGIGALLILWLAFTVSIFLLGLVLLLLFPRAADSVAKSKIGISLLAGLGVLILLPVLAFIAFVTIIGIPLSIVLVLAYVLLLALGYVSASWAIGRRILKPPKARILSFLVGLVILQLLALIPIGGAIIGLLVTLLGLGALATAGFRARKA